MATTLIELKPEGLYCAPADVYIDPWKPVARAIITHAHADHARPGHKFYLAHHQSATVLRLRLGAGIHLSTVGYGKTFRIRGVQFSLHPAGHIPGSAQIKISYKGESWVVSGDYKVEDDGLCTPFEPVRCHTFITESTFGLPVYQWRPQAEVFSEINDWWRQNQAAGKISLLSAYSLGKAQRVLQGLDPTICPIFTHGAVANTNEALKQTGYRLTPTSRVQQGQAKSLYKGGLVICPPSALGTPWAKKFQPYSTGIASGWMQLRGQRRRRAADRGFVLSDHADWPGLLDAIAATGAERVLATHGYAAVLAKFLSDQGLEAQEIQTFFDSETED